MIENKTRGSNSNTIRLLIIHPALPPYRLHLFNALADRCQLRLVLLRKNLLNQKFDQTALLAQLKVEPVYLARGITLLKRTFRLGIGAEIEKYKPDVVVTQEFSPATLAVAIHLLYKKNSFKHVVWTDDNPESISRDSFVRRLLRHLVLPRLDGLICLAEETASLYRTRFAATMPVGISPILHEESKFREAIVRATPVALKRVKEYQLEGKRVLLCVGRLATVKRIDRLLQAFSQFHDSFADVRLVLVGDGPQRGCLKELAKELGVAKRVIFAGRLEGDQLFAWYRVGGLFVLTSEFERFGAVVNEALLAGMPVVCSNKAGAKVLIREGVNGTVVDASDPVRLKSAIHELLQQTSPLSLSHLEQLLPSLMAITFKNSVDGFLSVVTAPDEEGLLS